MTWEELCQTKPVSVIITVLARPEKAKAKQGQGEARDWPQQVSVSPVRTSPQGRSAGGGSRGNIHVRL